MTDISRHPLLKKAYDVCQAIEMCGASVPLTNAVGKASELLRDLDAFIPVKYGPLHVNESHEMYFSSGFGGKICKNCGTPPGTKKACAPCKNVGDDV
ncbi:MAG TPA: hypothetical protein DCE36_12605 [Pseudomonas sp.]|nr:hypothetical protein [Pseudomonas sp.]